MDARRTDVTGGWTSHMRRFMICAVYRIILGYRDEMKDERGGTHSTHTIYEKYVNDAGRKTSVEETA